MDKNQASEQDPYVQGEQMSLPLASSRLTTSSIKLLAMTGKKSMDLRAPMDTVMDFSLAFGIRFAFRLSSLLLILTAYLIIE